MAGHNQGWIPYLLVGVLISRKHVNAKGGTSLREQSEHRTSACSVRSQWALEIMRKILFLLPSKVIYVTCTYTHDQPYHGSVMAVVD